VKPIVNLEETPGKQVGRRRAPTDGLRVSAAQSEGNAKSWQKAFGGLRIPRGVYRFRTHEEADEWLWQMMTRPRQ
jgi:hypothetical protein